MNTDWAGAARNPRRLFRLRFEQRLRRALGPRRSAAVEFGVAWEATLNEVPLEDGDQAIIYWELIEWVKSDELFTDHNRDVALNLGGGS